MTRICDHCGNIIGKTEWNFSIEGPLSYKHFYTCSEECFKNILHKQGIATYPKAGLITRNVTLKNKGSISLYISIIAFAIAIVAFILRITAFL